MALRPLDKYGFEIIGDVDGDTLSVDVDRIKYIDITGKWRLVCDDPIQIWHRDHRGDTPAFWKIG